MLIGHLVGHALRRYLAKGYGPYVFFAAFAGFLLTELAAQTIMASEQLYAAHPEIFLYEGAVASALVYAVVKWIEWRCPPRTETDAVTGEKRVRYDNDSLFLIPVRFWPALTLGFAVIMYIIENR